MRIATPQIIDQVFSAEDPSRVQTAAEIEKLLVDMNLRPLKVLSQQGDNQIVLKDYKQGILNDNASLGVVAKNYTGELTVISMYAPKTQSAIGRRDPKILLGEIGAAKTPVYVSVDYENNDPEDCKNGIYIKVGNKKYREEVTVTEDLIAFSQAVAKRTCGRSLQIHDTA